MFFSRGINMEILSFLKKSILPLFLMLFTFSALATCPCALRDKEKSLRTELELVKETYEQDPNEENLKNLSRVYAELEKVEIALQELEQENNQA